VTTPVKLLIVDDHRVFAEGLESVFRAEPDFEAVAAVTDPSQVLGVVAASRPDAVVMDVQLGDVSGIDLTAQLTALPAPPRVVVLTAYSDTATALAAIQAGAVGFVSKDGPAEHIVTAVRAAVRGFPLACSPWSSRPRTARSPSRTRSCSSSSPAESGRCCGSWSAGWTARPSPSG
jgi:DNA-binding NarL/FixJ family response regulator